MASIDDDDELRATRKLNGVDWKEDIQEGEYVRLKNGKIIKFKKFSIARRYSRYRGEDLINIKTIIDNRGCHYKYDNILKHSPNLIDLIEVGDYVNGKKVERINDYGDFKRADFNLDYDDCDAVYNSDIKSIVTHQQFNSVMYKVKE